VVTFETQKTPLTSVDGFYEHPEAIERYAKTLKYTRSKEYEGLRSEPLHLINDPLFHFFSHKVMSLMFDLLYAGASWEIWTAFHITKPTQNTPSWVHQDAVDCISAGIIHLSEDLSFDDGTSIYTPKHEVTKEMVDRWADIKEAYHGSGIDKQYKKTLKEQHTHFDETARIGAKYNRLVMYESSNWHAARPSETKERLTQVFFLKKLESVGRLPAERMHRIKGVKEDG